MRRQLQSPRCWHVILAPALPLLGLLFWNLESTPPAVVIWPLLIAGSIALIAWILLSRIIREPQGTALFLTVTILAAMSHSMIVRVASNAPIPYLASAIYGMVVFAAVLSLRVGARAPWLTTFANQALAIAVALTCAQIAYHEWQRPRIRPAPLTLRPSVPTDKPDVYVLILDGYGRADVLRELYGFENDLIPGLRSLGFLVADKALANYPQTVHSLASALNLDYLPELLRGYEPESLTRRSLGDLIDHNRLFEGFAAAGYRITFYTSEYEMLRSAIADDRRAPSGFMTSFDYSAFEASLVPATFEALGVPRGAIPLRAHRRQVSWTLDDLSRAASEGGSRPSLVFAHVLAPHPPFAVNKDGTERRTSVPTLLYDAEHWHDIAKESGERYESGYLDNVRYLNGRVLDVVRQMVTHARRPAIFYIQGDHGPASHLKWDEPAASDLMERMGILLAMRFPDDFQPPLAPAVTPINAFRVIANRALGTALPPLADRSYFASWERPFEFVDVTDAVIACGKANLCFPVNKASIVTPCRTSLGSILGRHERCNL